MLYIVRARDCMSDMYEYEYGNIRHALEHYEHETTADVIKYDSGKEELLRRKVDGKEREV